MKSLNKLACSVLIAVFLFSACGAPATNSTSNTGSTSENPASVASSEAGSERDGELTKIIVWTNNRHDADYVNAKVSEFNSANRNNIEIDYIMHTDNYTNMLVMAASSNQLPDIFNLTTDMDDYSLQNFVKAGMLIPLNDYIDDEFRKITNLDNYMMQDANVLGDQIYFAPTTLRSGVRFIWNKELFEAAGLASTPKTVDEMVDAAQKITEIGGGTKYGCVVPGLSSPMVRMILPIAEISGVSPYDYANGKFDFSGFKPILEAFRKMFTDGTMLPGAASMKVDPARVQFSEGNIGFYGNASQEVGVLTEQFPAQIEWGAAEMPSLTGEIKGTLSCTPYDGWAITSHCKNVDKAWEVVKCFSSVEYLKGYVEAGLNLAISPEVMQQVDMSKVGRLADFAPVSYEGVYPILPDVTPQGKVWTEALWESVLPDGPSIDSAIEQCNKIYNEALDRDVAAGKTKRLVISDFDPMKPGAGTFTYLDN